MLIYGSEFVEHNARATAAAARESLFGSLICTFENAHECGGSGPIPEPNVCDLLTLASLAHDRGLISSEVLFDLKILNAIFELIFAQWEQNSFARDDVAELCDQLQLPELLADTRQKRIGEMKPLRREQLADLDGDAGRCFYTAVLILGMLDESNHRRLEAHYQTWR